MQAVNYLHYTDGMTPVLIHLHIPKSAGSSHQYYLYKVLGKSRVYWYPSGQTREFFAEDTYNYSAIGGHRPLAFYPPDLDALFTTVLRDPIERALSYFSFRAAPALQPQGNWSKARRRSTDTWLKNGLDPHSLVKSIEHCEEFRQKITNAQCFYLSRLETSFVGAAETIKTTNIIVGVMDKLALFNNYFRDELGFEVSNKLHFNRSNSAHQKSAIAEENALELLQELNREDQQLYDYVCEEHNGLLVNNDSAEAIRSRLPIVNNGSNLSSATGHYNWSPVHLLSKGITGFSAGIPAQIPLAIVNGGSKNVVLGGKELQSSGIGWRLLDEDGVPIPGATGVVELELIVPPKSSRSADIRILADESLLAGGTATGIEYSIVSGGLWVCEDYPLNSAWSTLHFINETN